MIEPTQGVDFKYLELVEYDGKNGKIKKIKIKICVLGWMTWQSLLGHVRTKSRRARVT